MAREAAMCIPLNCRGLQVLGFPIKDKIFLSVHQLAIELWKAYDTPRVSVQRKINDLGIKIVISDRSMIRLLRAAGIIENFRATMILLRDAEILCDALDYSRKKRGLAKHALQSKHKPGERSTRREELSAKKFTEKFTSLYDVDVLQAHSVDSVSLTRSQIEPQQDIHDRGCSSFRDTLSPDLHLELHIDTLLVANEPVILGEDPYEEIKLVSLEAWKLSIHRSMDLPPQLHYHSLTNQPIRLQTSKFMHTEASYEEDTYKPLSSPNTETSEFDEIYSSPSTRSGHPSRSSDTPERFLYLQGSSSDSEEDIRREVKVHGGIFPLIDSDERTFNYGDKHPSKRVVGTKLRHFAQTSSPRTIANDPSPNSLSIPSATQIPSTSQIEPTIVTGKKKRGRPPKVKHPRPTALSTFATKKRPISRTPTPLEDGDRQLRRMGEFQGEPPSLRADIDKQTEVTKRQAPSLLQLSTAHNLYTDSTNTPANSVLDDDIGSVASVSTNSSGQRSSTRVTRRTRASEKEKQAPFRFNDLFNFYPPKLIVRDGELVPEQSLSVKHMDRVSISNLPESHPFMNWRVGEPVSENEEESSKNNSRKRKTFT